MSAAVGGTVSVVLWWPKFSMHSVWQLLDSVVQHLWTSWLFFVHACIFIISSTPAVMMNGHWWVVWVISMRWGLSAIKTAAITGGLVSAAGGALGWWKSTTGVVRNCRVSKCTFNTLQSMPTLIIIVIWMYNMHTITHANIYIEFYYVQEGGIPERVDCQSSPEQKTNNKPFSFCAH